MPIKPEGNAKENEQSPVKVKKVKRGAKKIMENEQSPVKVQKGKRGAKKIMENERSPVKVQQVKKGAKKKKNVDAGNKAGSTATVAASDSSTPPAAAPAANAAAATADKHRPRKEIVDLFWLVSDEDAKIRRAAVSKLSSFSSAEDTSYILKRLVGGLASDRPLVRPTFAAALAALLHAAAGNNNNNNAALLASVLKKVEDLEIVGAPKEKRGASLGRIYAYAAVVRAGLLADDDAGGGGGAAAKDALPGILKDLVDLSLVDRTTSKAAHQLLRQLVDGYSSASSFKEIFWPSLLPVFKLIAEEKVREREREKYKETKRYK